ncbi:M20 family metallopeptidase [Nonomuraea sp. NBC_01738]|nr:M20 family metallopeptidase [Nonomuraea sp. NBC_01738]
MLGDLRVLVECETPSSDRVLLDRGLAEILGWARARLGPPARLLQHPCGPHGDTVELLYTGDAPGFVLVLCHYDTVWPAGTLASWPFALEGGIVSGPGVFDMKNGLVQAVYAVKGLRALGVPHPSVKLLLNGDEELGSPASRPLIERASEGALATFVLEASLDGAVKTARKGVGKFDLTLHGVESHVGLDPEKGASAIHALAALILETAALAAPARGTTVNVGLVDGGTGRNVCAGRASCGIDIRVATHEEMARVDAALAALRPPDPRVRVELGGGWCRPPMTPNTASRALYATAEAIAAAHGWTLRQAHAGGASDGNFVSALGRPVLDGLGAVGAGAHARSEHLLVEHIPERTALLMDLIAAHA